MKKNSPHHHDDKLWRIKAVRRGDIVFAFFLRGLFILSIIDCLVNRKLDLIPVSGISLFLTFIPSILERSIKVSLPASFQIVLLIFIFNAQFLGELVNYYERYWWWDIMLHSWSGVLLGTIGFLLVYILNTTSGVNVIMSPIFISFFALSFAVTCGVLWEIFEYSMDLFFLTNMQKSGLVDTMGDLIVDFLGGLIVSLNGYIALRHHKKSTLIKAVSGFIEANPSLSYMPERAE